MATKKTKKKAEEVSAGALAMQLYDVRKSKNELLAVEKRLSTQLKALIKDGDTSQTLFEIITARTIEITDVTKAVAWAQQHYAHIITVDTKAAKAILQRSLAPLPEGFAVKDTDRLVVVGATFEE